MAFYPRTRRAADLTNKAESIMDFLVDNGFIIDDNWFECPLVVLRFVEVSPDNPHVDVSFS